MEMTATKATVSKYPAYKDSGEYWMAEIPEHWEIKKLKHVFHEKKKVTNPDLNCGSISYGKVVFKDDEKIPESTKASYQEVLTGEFLINPLNLNYDLVSLRIGLSEINVVVSSGYIVLKNSIDINKSYFNFLLHRYDVAYMKLLGSGVRQTINFNHIANSLLVFPPTEEQTAIAAFLDDKTAKIDRAIAQKEKMITLLKERKQIIIQNAVTKGLNPNAKMKDSGVEWIGEIPEGWEKIKLRWLSKIYAGGTPDKNNIRFWENGTIPWIASGEVNQEYIKTPTTYISKLGFNNSAARWMRKGDLIVALAGQGKTKGTVAYLDIDTTGNQSLSCVSPNKDIIESKFLFFFIKAAYNELRGVSGEGQRDGLNLQKLGDLEICIPEMLEQELIVAHIEAQSAKIDKAIALQEQQIEKLKELKSTLIDSAVTGKIKVS
jgi:type I restriction enzyme S subunit